MVTGFFLVHADSEPFFLSNFFSGVSRSAGRPAVRHSPSRQTRQFLLPHPHHFPARRPGGAGLRPSRQVKSLHSSLHSSHPQQVRPALGTPRHRKPTRTDPGLSMKLDYGGWSPIGFDENLPAKLKRGIKTADLGSVSEEAGIVTIDTAIASAPPAQSDDIPASPAQAASTPYIPSTGEKNNNNIIYIDSSKAPLSTYSVLEANNPAVAPAYQPAPSKPVFQSPQYIPRPAVPDKPYQAQPPVPASLYKPRPALTSPPTPPAPAPAQVDTEKYPIVALITSESDIPEEEKFVQFSIGNQDSNGGSPDSLPNSGSYQSTDDNTRLVKDVTSGSVRVNPNPVPDNSDELYYIYYQDPELDPSYGVKIQSERDAKFLGLDGLDIPLYDYDEAQNYRPERDQTPFGPLSLQSSSSVSFKQNINGNQSGFSYKLS